MDTPDIVEITGADPELRAVLEDAKLPTEDLGTAGRHFFRFSDGGGLIGFIGWEDTGTVALLRSLVVVPSRRRAGWGRILMEWALLRLAECGTTDAYLLTTGIQGLAGQLGFATIDRAKAPPPIRASHQFACLCPSTAILMHRSLP